MSLMTFAQVRAELGRGRSHLLLGNGFSIACDPLFSYGSLFDFAAQNGLSERAKGVFTYLGTNNFEGVMRLLEHGSWLVSHYASASGVAAGVAMAEDLRSVKAALISALTRTHFARPYDVNDRRLASCRKFLEPFYNVFTLNYDLLLYWVCMSDATLMRRDCFGSSDDAPDAEYVVFNEHLGGSQGILFLHGALHLYASGGEVRKHTWSRTGVPLIESIRAALDAGTYPLFVAEGLAQKKKEQIETSSYLSYCLGKLGRIEGPLVIYGWAMGGSDQHILDTIAYNEKLPALFVGLYGDPDAATNRATRVAVESLVAQRQEHIARHNKRGKALEVSYFDSATAPVWMGEQGAAR